MAREYVTERPLGQKNRVVLPAYVRQRLRLREGTVFSIYVDAGRDRIILEPRREDPNERTCESPERTPTLSVL